MAKHGDFFRELARLGAGIRLAQLNDEAGKIREAYPDLRVHRSSQADGQATDFGAFHRGKTGRTMSPAAKRAMSAGMRKYWARRKAGLGGPEQAVKKQKRTFSPEVRERLAASAKKRWAAAKKAGKTTLG